MPTPRLADAFTCDSFPKRLIALLNALIIPSYMMLRLLEVAVKNLPILKHRLVTGDGIH
jgi:hypothetical protein